MISGDKSISEAFINNMISGDKSNYERFLKYSSPNVSVQYTQSIGSSSSSAVAPGAEAAEVRNPRIVLRDIWSAYEEWSSYGLGVPLKNIDSKVTQYYTPSLSAIQIFTIKPFLGDASSSRSSSIGQDGVESSSAKSDFCSNSKPGFLRPDYLGNLYFQYNETTKPFQRDTLTHKIGELAEQYTGLNSLTSSDISPYSWFSVAWYPIYPIPPVKTEKKELSAAFLTYHSLTPSFTETIGEDDKKNEQGVSSTTHVVLPAFAAVTYKAFGDVWIMPGTKDSQMRGLHEESASSWLETVGFSHRDFTFFMSFEGFR